MVGSVQSRNLQLPVKSANFNRFLDQAKIRAKTWTLGQFFDQTFQAFQKSRYLRGMEAQSSHLRICDLFRNASWN